MVAQEGHIIMDRKPIIQGDVLLIPVTATPDTATVAARDNGQVILAYGEQPGHSHAIDSPDCTLFTAEQAGQLRAWLKVTAPVEVTHQKHDTVTVPVGDWEVIGQVLVAALGWAETVSTSSRPSSQRYAASYPAASGRWLRRER